MLQNQARGDDSACTNFALCKHCTCKLIQEINRLKCSSFVQAKGRDVAIAEYQ